jgi:hypothetical protein
MLRGIRGVTSDPHAHGKIPYFFRGKISWTRRKLRVKLKTWKTSARCGAITRRQWLGGAVAAGAAFTIVPRHVLGGANHTAPSDKLALAGIGIGGIGFPQLQSCEQAGFEIVALCDVDEVYGKKSFDRWPQAKRFRDYREMYEAMDSQIDAVYCATPDHSHAVIVLPALRRKKHVCCVKPITRTIVESARWSRRLGGRRGHDGYVVLEYQRRGLPHLRADLGRGDRSGARAAPVERPALVAAGDDASQRRRSCPATLDWDLWIGPAAMRPFKAVWPEGHLALEQIERRPRSAVYHPWNFRGWWDFGTGSLGDMGCHHANTPFRALKLTHPTSVSAMSTKAMPETAPLASIVTYEFPAREDMPPVRVVWYDGG